MKEQASVDREYIYTNELTSEITLISKVELERLQRLDENVKRRISFLKSDIEELERIDVSESIIDEVKEQLAELESLDKWALKQRCK